MGQRTLGLFESIACGAMILVAVGCTSGNPSENLAVDSIDDAIAAVDAHFGGPADFYEINATADGVNMFVATSLDGADSGVVQARYTSAKGLVVSDETLPSDGVTFSGAEVEFDPRTIIERAVGQLSSARPRAFIITAASGTAGVSSTVGVQYRLIMESQRGGRLVVFLGSDGSILGSDLLD